MSVSLKNVGAITLFVEDPQRSKAFYLDVFDAPVIYEDEVSVAFGFAHMMVNLLQVSEAYELIGPGVVASQEAGSRFQLTADVADVDAVSAKLATSGVELLNGPIDRPWGLRTIAFADPDGHIWEIAQPLKKQD